jgi:hypothetical protein
MHEYPAYALNYNIKRIQKEIIHSIYCEKGFFFYTIEELNKFLLLDFGLSSHTFSSVCMFLSCTDKYDANRFRFIYSTALWTVAMESQYFGGLPCRVSVIGESQV